MAKFKVSEREFTTARAELTGFYQDIQILLSELDEKEERTELLEEYEAIVRVLFDSERRKGVGGERIMSFLLCQ